MGYSNENTSKVITIRKHENSPFPGAVFFRKVNFLLWFDFENMGRRTSPCLYALLH